MKIPEQRTQNVRDSTAHKLYLQWRKSIWLIAAIVANITLNRQHTRRIYPSVYQYSRLHFFCMTNGKLEDLRWRGYMMDSSAPYPLSDCVTYIQHWHGERGVNANLLVFTLFQARYRQWVSADCITSLLALCFNYLICILCNKTPFINKCKKTGFNQIAHD